MKRIVLLVSALLMAMVSLAANEPKTITLTDAERTLVKQNSDFAFNLFRKTRDTENHVISPLSITYALGMLNNGAEGITREEISQVLAGGCQTGYADVATTYHASSSLASIWVIRQRTISRHVCNIRQSLVRSSTSQASASPPHHHTESISKTVRKTSNKTILLSNKTIVLPNKMDLLSNKRHFIARVFIRAHVTRLIQKSGDPYDPCAPQRKMIWGS